MTNLNEAYIDIPPFKITSEEQLKCLNAAGIDDVSIGDTTGCSFSVKDLHSVLPDGLIAGLTLIKSLEYCDADEFLEDVEVMLMRIEAQTTRLLRVLREIY